VIAHNTEQDFGSAVPPKNRILLPEVIYPTEATTGLNHSNMKKIARLIAQTGYLNRNVILIFRFKHLFPDNQHRAICPGAWQVLDSTWSTERSRQGPPVVPAG